MSDTDSKEGLNSENNNNLLTTKPHRLNKKSIRYVLIALVAAVLMGITGMYIKDNFVAKKETSLCSDRSNGSILYKANVIFKENTETVTKEQLDTLVQGIKEIQGYDQDANCLYPIMFGYILDNNFKTAKEEYDEFAKVYGDGSSFAKDIYPMQNINELKSLIDFSLKIQSDNTIKPTPNNVVGAGEKVSDSIQKDENN